MINLCRIYFGVGWLQNEQWLLHPIRRENPSTIRPKGGNAREVPQDFTIPGHCEVVKDCRMRRVVKRHRKGVAFDGASQPANCHAFIHSDTRSVDSVIP